MYWLFITYMVLLHSAHLEFKLDVMRHKWRNVKRDSQTTTNPHNLLYCTGSGCRQLDSHQSSQSAICTAQGPAVVAQWQSTSGSSQTPGDCQPLSLSSIFTWILTKMLVLFADNSTVDTNISVFHSSHEHQYSLLKPIL